MISNDWVALKLHVNGKGQIYINLILLTFKIAKLLKIECKDYKYEALNPNLYNFANRIKVFSASVLTKIFPSNAVWKTLQIMRRFLQKTLIQ